MNAINDYFQTAVKRFHTIKIKEITELVGGGYDEFITATELA